MGNEIHPAPVEFTDAQLNADPILRYFHYQHLPVGLAAVSAPFCKLAKLIISLPQNAERSVALRKLLEAKDAAVRANVPVAPSMSGRYHPDIERRAQEIYESLDYRPSLGDPEQKPLWVRNGNSTMQDICRDRARQEYQPAALGEPVVKGPDHSEEPIPFS